MNAATLEQRQTLSPDTFFKPLREQFETLLQTQNPGRRHEMFVRVGTWLTDYLERVWHPSSSPLYRAEMQYLVPAGIAIGHIMSASSLEEFDQRIAKYWHPEWDSGSK